MSSSPTSRKRKNKKPKDNKGSRNSRRIFVIGGVAVLAIIIALVVILSRPNTQSTTTATISTFSYPTNKPIIIYVNQGNAPVTSSNYPALISFAKSHHFNTIFFQIYRSGQLLFNQTQLSYFVTSSHLVNLSIFFALYFTGPSQQIPSSLYGLGENGINLDMSTLGSSEQSDLLLTLSQNYKSGLTAVTATNFTTTLRPNLLILETYSLSDQPFIHKGIIASVEPLALANSQTYEQELEYALNNCDGVMVFDYYGLLKTNY